MVLRLFSKSSPSADKAKTGKPGSGPAPGPASPGENASLEELVSAAQATDSGKERVAIVARIDNADALRELAQHKGCLAPCADRLATLAGVSDALALATNAQGRLELALGAHNTELRDAQLLAITSESELTDLEHASRSKNKACNRSARERLERLRHARTAASEAASTAADLADAAAALLSAAADHEEAHLHARFDALALKHHTAAEQLRSSAAVLTEFAETAPALSPMPLPPEVEAPDEAEEGPDFRALAGEFSALQEKLETGTPAAALAGSMQTAGNNWREAIALATPDAHSIDQVARSTSLYEKVSTCEALLAERADDITAIMAETTELTPETLKALPRKELAAAWKQLERADAANKTIRKLRQGLTFPASVPAPVIVAQLAERVELSDALLAAGKARRTELEDSFQTQVKRLAEALDSGELKRAEAARGEARSLQDALPGGSAQATRKRFGALLANMQNLRDWQHFATDPKREELCAQMTALADNPDAPDEQAERVKELRAQWNALGGKGPKEIAERFDAAAARAFEPCRLHYAALAEQRSANIATRKSILAQLETFVADTDWSTTDLNAARTILNSARTEWRSAFPVERGANRALEKRFKVVTDDLYAKLQDGWSGNLAAKEKLVETAEALLASEDPLPGRLDQAKRLQQQWKSAGPVPRGPDQKLWKRFRAACDALFNTRDAERNQAQAEYAARQTAAKARLAEFAELLSVTAPADIERSQLAALKADLNEIDNLDRTVIKQARELEDQFKAKLKTTASAQKEATLAALEALDVLAAQAETAGSDLPTEVLEGDKVFATRVAPNTNAHLDLVLEAETQAGIESPANDAQRRLELQVQWLNEGMNSGARKASDALDLARRWCALSATAESSGLRERLFAAAKSLL